MDSHADVNNYLIIITRRIFLNECKMLSQDVEDVVTRWNSTIVQAALLHVKRKSED